MPSRCFKSLRVKSEGFFFAQNSRDTESEGDSMATLVNRQWECFCIEYFGGKNKQDAAKAAGYSPRTAGAIASRLLRKVKIIERLQELQEEVASAAIMDVRERQERLSIFGREDITSDKGVLIRHGNVSAIAELTKMKGEYPPSKMEIAGKDGGPIEIADTRKKLLNALEAVAKRLEEKSEAEG